MGFKKGNIPWNKIAHLSKECICCKKNFARPPSQNHVKYCSQKCYHDSTNHNRSQGKTWSLTEETKRKMSVHQLGEDNHNWKGGITNPRKDAKTKRWRRAIIKRDAHLCAICLHEGNVAHHLNGFDKFKRERYTLSNGVCLCENCHTDFHKKYGYGNNTIKQFVEFIQHGANKNNQNRAEIVEKVQNI